ncbi:MAG TPA: hypothetical protein VFH51_17495, partial [Myxococcota bacterium]|nr:hypothetical protein [Myxococcota bacterium]
LGVDLGLGIPAFVRHDNLFVLAAVVFGGVVGVAGSVAAASYQVRLLKAWYRREQPAPQVAPAPLVMADAVRTWLSPYLLNTKLHRAIDTPFALNGMVTDLLQAGVSANQPDPQGRLPLDKALGRADPNLLKLLLRHGAQPLQEHVALAWRNGSAQQVGALLGIGDPARRAHLAEAVTPAQFREQLTGIGLLEPVLKAATPAHAHRLIHTTTVEAPSSPLHVVAATQQLELFALFLRHGADLTLASDTRRATAQAFVRANPRLAREVQRFHQERQAPAGPTDGEEPPPADVDDL